MEINDDPDPDLFYSIEYEEMVGGAIVLAAGTSAREAIATTPAESCRLPDLRDVNGDGRLDFISYRAAALPLDECHGDPGGDLCRNAFLTEWAVPHVQVSGAFVMRPDLARAFYGELAEQYASDAEELAADIARNTPPASTAPVCDRQVVARLHAMADSAQSLAKQ